MNMKVSIALCTYNGADFLRAQLESYVRQTRLPDELVVCDDRSTDETGSILEEFAAAAPFPLRIVRNETNLGTIKNFEKAISLCGGDIIFLSDQDDVWQPQKIARFCAEFEAHPEVGLIFSNAELTDAGLAPLGASLWDFAYPAHREIGAGRQNEFFKKLLCENVVTGATAAFRASLRDALLPIPANLPLMIHDHWIALAAAANSEILALDENLIQYRQHAGQQIGVEQMRNADRTKENYEGSLDMHRKNIVRLEMLGEMLSTLPVFAKKRRFAAFIPGLIDRERENIRHLETRGALGESRLKRIPRVFRELLSGRYHRFSNGLGSAAKDVLRKN